MISYVILGKRGTSISISFFFFLNLELPICAYDIIFSLIMVNNIFIYR